MSTPDPSTIAAQLDSEIASLRSQLNSLKRTLNLQTSTLLSSQTVSSLVAVPQKTNPQTPLSLSEPARSALKERLNAQASHNLQSLYRSCVGITTFRVSNPDPRAVGDGRVLGIRFEAPSTSRPGKFVRPYYVFLNQPWDDGRGADQGRKNYLKVHKHTVPECIPLSALAAKWLPPPPPPLDGKEAVDESGDGTSRKREKRQNLPQFCRSLRREIIRYHNRVSVITDLKRLVSSNRPDNTDQTSLLPLPADESTTIENTVLEADPLDQSTLSNVPANEASKRRRNAKITDVAPVDAEAKQIRIDWEDGRTGRLVLDNDGNVMKMAIFVEGIRDRETVRELFEGTDKPRIEEVVWRLRNV